MRVFALHHVLQHAVQGGDARPCGKHDEMLRCLVPGMGEQTPLRRVGHQAETLAEFAVDEGAAFGTSSFFDNHLGNLRLGPLYQTVRTMKHVLANGQTEGQIASRNVLPFGRIHPWVERDSHGLWTQTLYTLDCDFAWSTHG